jgi:saccharopine dehydrogenase-like NADP-dependent oxidoreductase
MRIGMRRWLTRDGVRDAIRSAVSRLHGGSAGNDRFALVVEARGRDGTVHVSLEGRVQAEATAIASSLFARALLDGEINRSGVWFPEEVVAPAQFFERLRECALVVKQSPAMD